MFGARAVAEEQFLLRRLPVLYALCALLITALLAVLTPPFFVPDEPNHAFRSFQIARGHPIAELRSGTAGGEVDQELYAAASSINRVTRALAERYPVASRRPDGRISPVELQAVQNERWAHKEIFAPFPNTAVYPPLMYLPQAAGWAMAERENLTIVHGLWLARVCAALAAIAVGCMALRRAQAVRLPIFAILLLPTCLSLNASSSQDAVLFSAAALATACLSLPLVERRQFRPGELLVTAAILTVCVGARLPYLPVLLLLLLPSLNLRPFHARSFAQALLAVLCSVGIVAAWQLRVRSFPLTFNAGANPSRQETLLLAHPVHGAVVIAKSAILGSLLTSAKGVAWMGTNDAAPPLPVYGLLALSFVAIVVLGSTVDCLLTWRSRLLLLIAVAGSSFVISLAEYLIWSPPGSAMVEGLQSRYYVPLLLFLTIAIPRIRLRDRLGGLPLPVAFILFLACISTVPAVAAHRFYGTGLLAALRTVLR